MTDSAPPSGVDLACVAGAFLDLTLVGLEALPGPGEERFASDLVRSPGGAAISAIAAARLGLSTVLVSPLGDDEAGDFLRGEFHAEGVGVVARRVSRTPTTVVLPAEGDRAMATYDPRPAIHAQDIAAVRPRAVLSTLECLALVPPATRAYASVGDREASDHANRLPPALASARALLANEGEALRLTGERTADAAAHRLAEQVEAAVVTLGPRGALAVVGGTLHRVPGEPVEAVDTTGAGDVFAATWVWGDLIGLDPELRLRYAVLAAALSVTVPTGAAGAVSRARLESEAQRRGLPEPPAPPRSSAGPRRSPALG